MLTLLDNTDLFELDVQALGHGVNAVGAMGAGIAYEFRKRFPDMYTEYRAYCIQQKGLAQGIHVWKQLNGIYVFNLFTQLRTGPCATLNRCSVAFHAMFQSAKMNHIESIGLPAVGCGIGSLKWPDVQEVLEENIQKTSYNGKVTVAFK